VYIDCRERARVLEDHSAAIAEMKDSASESRQWITIAVEDPVPVHPKMNVQDAAIGEMHELMLSATLDAFDSRAGQGSQRASR
jgi:hypothetical protein